MWNACVRVCASLFLPWPAGSVLRAATSTPPIATFPVSSLTKLGLNDYGTLRTIYWIYDANTWGMNVLLDICCQHLEKICNFEGFCLGNEHILLDICCQHLRIYVSWRVSVGPSGPGLGNVLWRKEPHSLLLHLGLTTLSN